MNKWDRSKLICISVNRTTHCLKSINLRKSLHVYMFVFNTPSCKPND